MHHLQTLKRTCLILLFASYASLIVYQISHKSFHSPFSEVLNRQKPFVTLKFHAQLGNQLFQAAAAIALALDNQCELYLPEKCLKLNKDAIGINMQKVMWRLPVKYISKRKINYTHKQREFTHLDPIPFKPNMRLNGYYESEIYFKKHKETIIDLFSPSPEGVSYLKDKYKEILAHPKSVALHVRTFYRDYLKDGKDLYQYFPAPDLSYFKKATELFGEDALFVVFSDNINWCKKNLSHLSKNLVFIENETHYHDFYLISLCKHVITSNSTFSWWAAYINRSPNKIVVARTPWFIQKNRGSDGIIPEGWITIIGDPSPPVPSFE